METEMLELLNDDYIGDELTIEDLQHGFSAFLEDERSESSTVLAMEMI